MYDYSMRVNSSFFNKYVVICYWFNKLLGTFYVITNPTGLLFNTSFHWSKKYYANARKHKGINYAMAQIIMLLHIENFALIELKIR